MGPCTKEEALAAVRAQAFTEYAEPVFEQDGEDEKGPIYRDVTPPGRTIVHCFMGFMGADWDLEGVEAEIQRADEIWWVGHLMGHDLLVRAGGKEYCFQVKQEVKA